MGVSLRVYLFMFLFAQWLGTRCSVKVDLFLDLKQNSWPCLLFDATSIGHPFIQIKMHIVFL